MTNLKLEDGREISTVSFDCRDIRHSWERADDQVMKKHKEKGTTLVEFRRVLVCQRCTTQRIDHYVISRMHVEKVSSRYVYPNGYQVKGGFNAESTRIILFKGYLK